MKKFSIIVLVLSMSTTSVAASCHKEPVEVKQDTQQMESGRQPSSIEQEKMEAQEHKEYLEKLDQGVTN